MGKTCAAAWKGVGSIVTAYRRNSDGMELFVNMSYPFLRMAFILRASICLTKMLLKILEVNGPGQAGAQDNKFTITIIKVNLPRR